MVYDLQINFQFFNIVCNTKLKQFLSTLPEYDEKKLLVLTAQGDEQAFVLLLKHYSPLLELSIQKVIKDDYGVSEALQETLIKIWLNREKLAGLANARSYFSAIALNQCFDYLKKLAREDKIRNAIPNEQLGRYEPEEQFSYKETHEIIQQAIHELPEQRRKIYTLSRNEGLNSVEIANQLGLNADYIRQAISAARAHIKNRLLHAGKILFLIWSLFF